MARAKYAEECRCWDLYPNEFHIIYNRRKKGPLKKWRCMKYEPIRFTRRGKQVCALKKEWREADEK